MFREIYIKITIMFVILLISAAFVHSHSGRTDKYGGHHDRQNGGYHYHNSGTVRRPATAMSQGTTSQGQLKVQQQAVFDANLDVGQHVSAANWFLAGVGCGVITFAYAIVDTPQVPTTRLLGKSPDYVTIYTVEYRSKAKTKRITNSCLGWGTFALLYLAYLGSTSSY